MQRPVIFVHSSDVLRLNGRYAVMIRIFKCFVNLRMFVVVLGTNVSACLSLAVRISFAAVSVLLKVLCHLLRLHADNKC